MMDWWDGLAQRERILIRIAGALIAFVVAWYLILVPMLSSHSTAVQKLELEKARLEKIEQALQVKRVKAATLTQENDAPRYSGSLKSKITQTASEVGLSVTRLQGDDQSAIGVFLDSADPRLLFYWIDILERRYGVRVTRLTVDQSGGEFVRVRLELERKG